MHQTMLKHKLSTQQLVQVKECVKGKHWFTEEDRKKAAVLKTNNPGKAIMTILRHLDRIQEVRLHS